MQTLKMIYHLFPLELWMAITVIGVMTAFVIVMLILVLLSGDDQNEDK